MCVKPNRSKTLARTSSRHKTPHQACRCMIECALHNTRKLSAADLPEAACLTLPLEQGENVALLHGTLDIADDAALLVIDEFDTDLSHIAGAASAAEHPEKKEVKMCFEQKPQNSAKGIAAIK